MSKRKNKPKKTNKATQPPTTKPKQVHCKVTPCDTDEESKAIGVGAVRYVYRPSIVWPTHVTHVVVRLPYQGDTIEIDFPVNGHKTSTGKTWTLLGTAAKPTLRPLLKWNNITAMLYDGSLTVTSGG